jgi:hypothetical protein
MIPMPPAIAPTPFRSKSATRIRPKQSASRPCSVGWVSFVSLWSQHTLEVRLYINSHFALVGWPVHDQFRMFPPKRLGDVAVPADGPMRPQRFLQLLGGDLVPLNGLALGTQ